MGHTGHMVIRIMYFSLEISIFVVPMLTFSVDMSYR